jgi:hypothetical protein
MVRKRDGKGEERREEPAVVDAVQGSESPDSAFVGLQSVSEGAKSIKNLLSRRSGDPGEEPSDLLLQRNAELGGAPPAKGCESNAYPPAVFGIWISLDQSLLPHALDNLTDPRAVAAYTHGECGYGHAAGRQPVSVDPLSANATRSRRSKAWATLPRSLSGSTGRTIMCHHHIMYCQNYIANKRFWQACQFNVADSPSGRCLP